MAADLIGDGGHRGTEGGDLVGDRGNLPFGGAHVVFDDGSYPGVSIEGGAADPCDHVDGGAGDGLSVSSQVGAAAFDTLSGVMRVHLVACSSVLSISVISESRRASSLWWRSAFSIYPRCSASSASAWASTR